MNNFSSFSSRSVIATIWRSKLFCELIELFLIEYLIFRIFLDFLSFYDMIWFMEGDKNFKFQFHFIEIKGFRLIGKFLFFLLKENSKEWFYVKFNWNILLGNYEWSRTIRVLFLNARRCDKTLSWAYVRINNSASMHATIQLTCQFLPPIISNLLHKKSFWKKWWIHKAY